MECALCWNQLFYFEMEKRHVAKFKKNIEFEAITSLQKPLLIPEMNDKDNIFEMHKKMEQIMTRRIKLMESDLTFQYNRLLYLQTVECL